MLRIANIIEEGKYGGPQERIANVAAAIKDDVETVVVLPKANSETFRTKLDRLKIKYKVFNLSRITREFWPACRYILFSIPEVIQVASYLHKEKFDIVHVSGGAWQYKGVIAGRLAGIKVIWHLNDTYLSRPLKLVFSFVKKFTDAYIYSSIRTLDYYQPIIKDNKQGFLVHPPVDTEYYSPDSCISSYENGDLWEGKIVIGTTANVNPTKGIDIFIRAAEKLNKEFDDIKFVVVGKVYKNQIKYYDKCKAMCDELNIKNMEFISNCDEVRPLLNHFNLYVCTSFSESGPISLWEALSMGKPIISTDVGDVHLFVNQNVNGEIVNVGDYQELARKISDLINDTEKRKEYGVNSRKIAIKKLDIKLCARAHINAYVKVLDSKHNKHDSESTYV
jgi:glycosyltransferase involved in cell wall biosynthesis